MSSKRKERHATGILVLLLLILSVLPSAAISNAQGAILLFPETGKTVSGKFLAYWDAHGGLMQQGLPISGELQERSDIDGKTYTMQYFERSVFESHPENMQPYDVLLSLLGSLGYKQKYPNGAPGQTANTGTGSRIFPETGKYVGGLFLDYWQSHGGLAQQGFPVSEEFQEKSELDGKIYTVQYFERAVLELHPENSGPYNVLLSQLGTFRYRTVYARASVGGVSRLPSSMLTPRACHSATLLPNGKVLIAGGMQRDGVITSSTELFDPATGTFTSAGNMATERACQSATVLRNGKVLLAGSFEATSAELYDPSTGAFAPTGSLHYKRDGFAATLLQDGRVLITGVSFEDPKAPSEIYDPATGVFSLASPMTVARFAHTATLLPDGKVLIAGGAASGGAGSPVLSSAELYDPATSTFRPTGDMTVGRHKHAAMLLPDGNVLIAGGADSRDWRGRYASAEIFNTRTGTFTPTGSMGAGRFKFRDAVTQLQDGKLLVGGGGQSVEIYDPATGAFAAAQGSLDAPRYFATATRLQDGRVLIVGGYDTSISVTAGAWIYK
jgi:hypothetical protein